MKELKIKTPTAEELKRMHEEFMSFLRTNPNNFSYWFPHIEKIADNEGISVPKSIIIPVPEELYKAFFQEQEGDSEKIDNWVLDHVVPVIEQTPWLNGHKIFIKNGCYSHKFNFTNGCLVTDQADEEQLIKNICNIQYEAICYDKCGYLELILREYIEPEKADTPTIYHGMPLRPEIRIFYNFDIHQLLYAINYWDWDYCHDAICCSFLGEDKLPDADIYEAAYPTLDAETKRLFEKHRPQIEKALATVTTLQMPGEAPNIWSVDFLMEENRVWLIDMAQGWRSAYWDRQKAGV